MHSIRAVALIPVAWSSRRDARLALSLHPLALFSFHFFFETLTRRDVYRNGLKLCRSLFRALEANSPVDRARQAKLRDRLSETHL